MSNSPSEAGEYEKDLDPYFLAIGKVSSAWNRVQDSMALLFIALHDPVPRAIPLAVWCTVKSDRGQREMLKAATAAWFQDDELERLPKALEDITWIINRLESLEEHRNNALHAPLGIGIDQDARAFAMVPWTTVGNPRALKLKGKKLLEEFAWYAETAQVLTRFCYAIHLAIASEQAGEISLSWPDRPRMPRLGQPHAQTV